MGPIMERIHQEIGTQLQQIEGCAPHPPTQNLYHAASAKQTTNPTRGDWERTVSTPL